jgi:hypothetical protein
MFFLRIKKDFLRKFTLFISEYECYRYSGEVKMTPKLVFQEAFIRQFDVLRQITEKGKSGRSGRKLGHIFDHSMLKLKFSWICFCKPL